MAFVLSDQRGQRRSEEHTSELQSRPHLVCRLLLEIGGAVKPPNPAAPRSPRAAPCPPPTMRVRQLRPPVATRRHRRFFFNDTATTEIYTPSLHDALPI